MDRDKQQEALERENQSLRDKYKLHVGLLIGLIVVGGILLLRVDCNASGGSSYEQEVGQGVIDHL